ncbi:hypothetical protein IWX77_003095 [Cryobacterium sp. CAN_C2]|nr:hypothetical protein [Cryobacterium sp. CAN_C3]
MVELVETTNRQSFLVDVGRASSGCLRIVVKVGREPVRGVPVEVAAIAVVAHGHSGVCMPSENLCVALRGPAVKRRHDRTMAKGERMQPRRQAGLLADGFDPAIRRSTIHRRSYVCGEKLADCAVSGALLVGAQHGRRQGDHGWLPAFAHDAQHSVPAPSSSEVIDLHVAGLAHAKAQHAHTYNERGVGRRLRPSPLEKLTQLRAVKAHCCIFVPDYFRHAHKRHG